jgi:uncharacterized membrane protein YccC
MNNDGNQGREQDLLERIMSLIRANRQARTEPIRGEELQKLRTAASRLDGMLQAAAEGEQQALRSAAARLDQLLAAIRRGKDVSGEIKRRAEQGPK